jgi:hypothetical protein
MTLTSIPGASPFETLTSLFARPCDLFVHDGGSMPVYSLL